MTLSITIRTYPPPSAAWSARAGRSVAALQAALDHGQHPFPYGIRLHCVQGTQRAVDNQHCQAVHRRPGKVLGTRPAIGRQGASPDELVQCLAKKVKRRSEEQTSELQSLMRISYAGFCLKKKQTTNHRNRL